MTKRMFFKKGDLMHETLIYLILAALLVALFLMATANKTDSRYVKEQVLEKELALLVDSALPGMKFGVNKVNLNGDISDVRIERGRIYVDLVGVLSIKGYSFFSKYDVSVEETEDKFYLVVA